MPVTDIVKPALKIPFDLTPFDHPIWNKDCPIPAVRHPRFSSTLNLNNITFELSKKLAAGFRNIGCHLPVLFKTGKNSIRQNNDLTGVTSEIRDHVARTRRLHTGQEPDSGHGRDTVTPPSPGSPISMIHSVAQVPPVASMRRRDPIQIR